MNALSRSALVFGLLFLALLACPNASLRASGTAPTPSPEASLRASGIAPAITATVPVMAPANLTYVWNQIQNFMYNTFRSKERMIQLTLIGVIIGLFIMLRRMPGKV